MTCNIGTCDQPVRAQGLCGKHYQRWRKYGDPLATKLDRECTPPDRFWAKVDKGGPLPEYKPELGPCWIWTAGKSDGYGMFKLAGKQIHAHRLSYLWLAAPIPPGAELDHLCRVRACCNPAHLEPVAHKVNVDRGVSPWGLNAGKVHCDHGHQFTPDNTYINPSGSRVCRKCQARRNTEWYRRQKG